MSHFVDFVGGFESLIDEYQTNRKPISPEAIYTNTTLKLHGITPSSMGGLENFITEGLSKVWKAICDFFKWIKDVFTGKTKAKENEILKAAPECAKVLKECTEEKQSEEFSQEVSDKIQKEIEQYNQVMAVLNAKIIPDLDKLAQTPVAISQTDVNITNEGKPAEKATVDQDVVNSVNKNIDKNKPKAPKKSYQERTKEAYDDMRENFNKEYGDATKLIEETNKLLKDIKLNPGNGTEQIKKLVAKFMSALTAARYVTLDVNDNINECFSNKDISAISKNIVNIFGAFKKGIVESRKEIEHLSEAADEVHKPIAKFVVTNPEGPIVTSYIKLDGNIARVTRMAMDAHFALVNGLGNLEKLANKYADKKSDNSKLDAAIDSLSTDMSK